MRHISKILKAKFRSSTKGERGVALIFTLGILGLLMVLALGFASSSMTERKIASNAIGSVSAQMLAKSALQRVVAGMTADIQGVGDTFFSYASSGQYDWLWKLRSLIATDSVFQNGTTPGVCWQYVDNGYVNEKKELVGRFAYVAIGNGGRLDPSVCVDSGVIHPSTSTYYEAKGYIKTTAPGHETRPGIDVYEINLQNLEPSATNYLTWDGGEDNSGNIVNKLSSKEAATVAGKLPQGARWESLDKMFNDIGLVPVAPATDTAALKTKRDKLSSWFKLGSTADPEAFWVDDNSDSAKTAQEYYHRFNLRNGNWPASGAQVTQTFFNAVADGGAQRFCPEYNSSGVSSYAEGTNGINYLKNWNNAGAFGSAACCKRQIAANLIDYSAPMDAKVTSGDSSGILIAPGSWAASGTNKPAFVGQKRIPLINEVDVEMQCSVTVDCDGGGNYSYSVSIIPRIGVELIDLYGAGQTDSYNTSDVKLYGNVSYEINGVAQTPVDLSTVSLSFTPAAGPTPYGWSSGYSTHTNTFATISIPSTSTGTTAPSVSITGVSANVTHAILNYNGSNSQFCNLSMAGALSQDMIGGTSGVVLSIPGASASSTTSRYGKYSYQADDPRVSVTDSANIVWPTHVKANEASTGFASSGIMTFGVKNTGVTLALASSSFDYEAVSEPAYVGLSYNQHLSTAYIRGGNMQSPWELGCIHRGKEWQTLNLTAYQAGSGGAAYSAGDANILDQVKFTASTRTYGKVNVNSTNADVLRALFSNIYITEDDPSSGTRFYDNPGNKSGKFVVPVTSGLNPLADAFATALKGASATGKFKNRAEILRATNGVRQDFCSNASSISNYSPSTKGMMEEFVGKFINLTKAELGDSVTVIVLAQAFKDAGAPWDAGSNAPAADAKTTPQYKDWLGIGSNAAQDLDDNSKRKLYGYCSYDETAACGTITMPNPTLAKKGQYDIGIDSILGESKIIATLEWDPTVGTKGSWVIQRIEYTDN